MTFYQVFKEIVLPIIIVLTGGVSVTIIGALFVRRKTVAEEQKLSAEKEKVRQERVKLEIETQSAKVALIEQEATTGQRLRDMTKAAMESTVKELACQIEKNKIESDQKISQLSTDAERKDRIISRLESDVQSLLKVNSELRGLVRQMSDEITRLKSKIDTKPLRQINGRATGAGLE